MTQPEFHVTDDDRRFFDDIPAYLKGMLSADDRDWMDTYLARHPNARKQLEFERDVMRGVEAMVEAIPQDQGLEALRQRRRANQTRQSAHQPDSVGLMERLKAWLFTGPAFAAAMSVIAIQFVAIVILARPGDVDEAYVYHRGVEQQPVAQASARLSLRPDAPLGDVLVLLRTHSASIVSGPSATGEIWIAISHDEKQALDALRSSALVESVTQLEATP